MLYLRHDIYNIYIIIFIRYVLNIQHKLYIASCQPPSSKTFWAHIWKEDRETYIIRVFFRSIRTRTPHYIHTTCWKKAVAFETSVYVVWCVFFRRRKIPFTYWWCTYYRLSRNSMVQVRNERPYDSHHIPWTWESHGEEKGGGICNSHTIDKKSEEKHVLLLAMKAYGKWRCNSGHS
jgi:hypothetical protein